MAGNTTASGIVPRTYKSGSIIYFENDRADNIYILKQGKIVLTSIKLDTGEEVKENVRIGEFFGVKSALGKYPREETAQTVGETTILVLRPSDFENLVLKNVSIVRKMLRVFSNQLRRIHKMVRTTLGQTETADPAVELFKIGEYYYKTGVYQQALYAYKKYMEHYPDTQFATKAMQRIREIEMGNVPSGNEMDVLSSSDDFQSSDLQFDSYEPSSSADFGASFDWAEPSSTSEMASDLDNFLSDDTLPDFNDFSFGNDEPSASNRLEEAGALFEQGLFAEASVIYEEILSSSGLTAPEDIAEANLNMGCCKARLGKNKDALSYFNIVIKNHQSSPQAKKAYYEVGDVFRTVGQNDKALPYYKRAASIKPQDDITDEAIKKIKQLQG